MITVFKEKLNFQLPFIFYISIRYVFETVFISKQIVENWFGALLEISDKFISSGFMILQFRLKTVSKPYFMGLETMAKQFYLKGHGVYHKSQGLFFRNGKIYEVSILSPLHPTKYELFLQNCFAWGNKLLWTNLWWDVLDRD